MPQRTVETVYQELRAADQEITRIQQQRAESFRLEDAQRIRRQQLVEELKGLEGAPAVPTQASLLDEQPVDEEEQKAQAWRERTLLDPEAIYTQGDTEECKSARCKARIVKVTTRKGATMPVDLDPAGRPTSSHFTTCAEPERFSRNKKSIRK